MLRPYVCGNPERKKQNNTNVEKSSVVIFLKARQRTEPTRRVKGRRAGQGSLGRGREPAGCQGEGPLEKEAQRKSKRGKKKSNRARRRRGAS